jgi:hypothetical protein
MKKKLQFEVYGYNDIEIERRALKVVSEYLNSDIDKVQELCDIEVEVSAKSQMTEVDGELEPAPAFLGKVFVRVK